MRENLEPSLKLMFGAEGGYSNRKTDRGGATKYGITHKTLAHHRGVASVTAEQVKKLTLSEAKEIYVESYWPPSGGDVLPTGLDFCAFDFGVNSGPMTAVKKLQKVLKVEMDGWIGPATKTAVKDYKGGIAQLITDYCAERMRFFRSIRGQQGFPVNGRGWTIRVTGIDPKGEWPNQPGVIGNALSMAQAKKGAVAETVIVAKPPEDAPGDSKAFPNTPNPWLSPEALIPVAGLLPGIGAVFTGDGPVQLALAAVLVLAVGLGAFLIIRKQFAAPVT